MSIQALPADACRLLSSSTLITTPVSLVKELIDNAIDAGATSIEVFAAPNAVDKIEVHDNGHGIAIANFDALGRRGYTSKLRRLEDLKIVGSKTLGFRGEGLASANTLGFVAITTRTANDAVASAFRLVPNLRGVSSASQKPASAPIGTTVSVACLYASLPVRRKVAIQDAAKTVAAIKAMLSGYALARPYLRLAFKVMQGKTGGWYYRPLASTSPSLYTNSAKQATLILFGAEAVRQCQEITVNSADLLHGQSILFQSLSGGGGGTSTADFTFDVCLPRPDADLSKLKLGGFVSVDGRPLSSEYHNSTAKKLLDIFHTALLKSRPDIGSQRAIVRDAFICLNIKSTPGSYDANVESAKADVLFTDEVFLCEVFRRFCGTVYTEAQPVECGSQQANTTPGPSRRRQARVSFNVTRRTVEGVQQNHGAAQNEGNAAREQLTASSDRTGLSFTTPDRSNGRPTISQPSSMFSDGSTQSRQSNINSNRPTEYSFTPPRAELSQSPVYIPLSPLQRRQRRPRVPTRSLQTPPSSSPEDDALHRTTSRQQELGSYITAMRSLVPRRQTTIFFGRNRSSYQSDNHDQRLSNGNSGPDLKTATDIPQPPNFQPARELPQQGRQADSETSPPFGRPQLNQTRLAAQPATGAEASVGQHATPKRPTHTMRVDLHRLRRSAARFAKNMQAAEKDAEYLSPEMADISNIEARLRSAIAGWLAKTRPERIGAGEGPVQVELYLKKSLKKKALAVTTAAAHLVSD